MHGVSQIYKKLVAMAELKIPPYMEKWEKELGARVSEQHILRLIHSSAVDTNTTKISKDGTYITLDNAHRYQSGKSPYCWQGCKVARTMAHIWLYCPKTKKY